MIKPVLFVDIDGVMADSISRWLARYNLTHGTNHRRDDVTSWDTRECIGADLSSYFNNYDFVEPIPHAFENVTILSDKYRIVYATVGQGSSWMLERSPNAEIALIQDKSLLRGFALIDDRQSNLDNFVGKRFLLSQPWNRNRGLKEMSWEEITRHLMMDY